MTGWIDNIRQGLAARPRLAAGGLAGGGLVLVLGVALLFGGPTEQKDDQGTGSTTQVPVVPRASTGEPVDSFAPVDAYRLDDWTLDEQLSAGWLDNISVVPKGGLEVSRNDEVLLVSGWAGEISAGVQTPSVVLTACDTVIGAAEVKQSRPDVAQTVHPNLANSGWSARLLVGHLVRCEGSVLEAWAVHPNGRELIPLKGRVNLNLPAPDPALSLAHFAPRPVLRPNQTAALPVLRFTLASPAALVRGPEMKQAALLQLAPGRYEANLIDERNDWLLLEFNHQFGWLPRQGLKVAP